MSNHYDIDFSSLVGPKAKFPSSSASTEDPNQKRGKRKKNDRVRLLGLIAGGR